MRLDSKVTRLAEASPEAIADAAACLRAGGLVAMPTETVYGLAADANSDDAVAAIYAAKERPRFNPLICHYADTDAAFSAVRADALAYRLAAADCLVIREPHAPAAARAHGKLLGEMVGRADHLCLQERPPGRTDRAVGAV